MGPALMLAGCGGAPRGTVARSEPTVAAGLDSVRSATRAFQSLDAAVAAGYPRDVPNCIADAQQSAMGYHHVNRAYVDAKLNVTRPQILLYERLADGSYRLNGVEFIMPYRLWARDSVPPTILGQNLKRSDELQLWYLHVWAWTKNNAGVFADFNPAARCRPSANKA
jgi:hypothetical protein